MTSFPDPRALFRELTDDERTLFSAWRAVAHEKMPYYENGLHSLTEVACDHPEIVDTFAVDKGLRLYMNFDQIAEKKMSLDLCAEALLHEIGHLVGDHVSLAEDIGVDRSDSTEAEMWNYSGDCAINDDLRDAGCDALAQYGALAESINEPDYQTPIYYMRQMRESRKKNEDESNSSGGQDSGQEGESGDGSAQSQDQSGQGGGSVEDYLKSLGGSFGGCGSISGGQPMPTELSDEGMGPATEAKTDFEKEQVREEVANAITAAKERGDSISDHMVEIAQQALAPSKTPWESILMSFITSGNSYTMGFNETSHNVINRRYPELILENDSGEEETIIIMPGFVDPMPRLADILDTSGSMDDDDIFTAMGEIDAIAKRLGLGPEDHTVTQVDTIIHETIPYVDASSIKERTGFGGTSMDVGIEHLANLPIEKRPSVIVVCTDGVTPWPKEMVNNIPVVTLTIVGDGAGYGSERYIKENWPVPAWIKSVYVTREQMKSSRERAGGR